MTLKFASTFLLLNCALVLVLSGEINAQDQKIGYFESDLVVAQLPEYAGIEQRLQLLSSGWQQEAQEMLEEVTTLEEDYQAKEILYTEEIRSQKLAEIEQKKTTPGFSPTKIWSNRRIFSATKRSFRTHSTKSL